MSVIPLVLHALGGFQFYDIQHGLIILFLFFVFAPLL